MKSILADICFWFHWVWIAILIGTLFMPKFRTINLIMGTTTIASQIIWLGCPLVLLEARLRGGSDFEGSFIAYYVQKAFSIQIPSWFVFVSLLTILMVNTVIYVLRK